MNQTKKKTTKPLFLNVREHKVQLLPRSIISKYETLATDTSISSTVDKRKKFKK